MSGRELARRLNASPSWVNFRLTGAQPINLDDLQHIAEVLEVDITDLLPAPSRLVTNDGVTYARRGQQPNVRLARSSVRRTRKRATRVRRPIDRTHPSPAAPTVTVAPTTRRPMLAAGPSQRIPA
jgi:transcriptional regulator with XRE-family HTH domain